MTDFCICPDGYTCGSPECRQVVAHPEKYEVRDGAVYVKASPELLDLLRRFK